MKNNADPNPSGEEQRADLSELAFLRKQVRQLNDRLKEIEKHKSSFLSNMRNEIINPFSSILSLSANLLRGEQASQSGHIQKAVSLIYQETFALDFHLKTIFLAAEIESGECYPSPALMRPEGVIAETLLALDHLFLKKKVRLVVYQSFEEDVWGDSDKLQMIFLGVLYHVLMKSSPGNGISVKAFTKEGVLHAEIYNTSVLGNEWSLFDTAHFKDLCMFNEDIEGIHLSVARSLTESLNGRMEVGTFRERVAGYRFYLPVAVQGEGKDVFEDEGLIFH